jgi:4-diphosphocytidyl-2-C-methyl-D-erythritol kinase
VLRALNTQSGTLLTAEELRTVGLTLGADVPMCLAGCALRAEGIGETITLISGWPVLPVVLVWPGRPVSTAEAFKKLARRDNPPLPTPPMSGSVAEIARWVAGCRNDLEAPALAIVPEIGDVLDRLRSSENCLVARMSGSGSACFGLYETVEAARAVANSISRRQPGWWVRAAEAR